MSITLEDNKRTAITVKLADMKATQNLLSGIAGGIISHSDHEMGICDLIHLDDEQQKQLATDFKTAKSQIQDQRLADASH